MRGHLKTIGSICGPLWVWSIIGAFASLVFLSDRPSWVPQDTWARWIDSPRTWLLDSWQLLVIGLLFAVLFRVYFKLHALLKPKLRITFEDNSYFRRGEHTPFDKQICQTLLIKMENISESRLEECSVRLEDVVGDDGHRPFTDLPAPLQRVDGAGVFPLRPNSPKLAYVVSAKQDDPSPQMILRLTTRIDDGYTDQWHSIGPGPYTISIGLFADTASCTERFLVFFDDRKCLRMVRS